MTAGAPDPLDPASLVPYVAVAQDTYARGVDGPDSDWRVENAREVKAAYRVLDLWTALTQHYDTDAHLVSYIVREADGTPLAQQPRVNKPGLAWLQEQGYRVDVSVFFCDSDNPGHAEWTEALLAAARECYAAHAVLQSTGIYHTAHGCRIVQPLSEALSPEQAEAALRTWLLLLEAAGVVVDWACKDWTRHYRLPHVKRKGKPYRSPFVHLESMRAIAPPCAAEEPAATSAGTPAKASKLRAPLARISSQADLPEVWRERAAPIAQAIAETVHSDWHEMYLALGGALLGRKLQPEHLRAVIELIAGLAHSQKPWSHARSAEDTVRNYVVRNPVTGYARLRERWPGVAAAVDEVTAVGVEKALRAEVAGAPSTPPPSLEETTAALEAAFRKPPDGLSVVSAECGLGKTQAALKVAIERAATPYRTDKAQGLRVPLHSKTSISVDKTRLAEQLMHDVQGAKVRRIFGPLSLLDADNKPVCHFHDVARPLVDGGQSVQWEFCEGRNFDPCPLYATCPARLGQEGPDDARITIGTHGLLPQLDGDAGKTGLLVIDEPPALLETLSFTSADFDEAIRRLMDFEGRYHFGMLPALHALQGWLKSGEHGLVLTPKECFAKTEAHVATQTLATALSATLTKATGDFVTDVVAAVEASVEERRTSKAPPLRRPSIHLAKGRVAFAEELGRASKLLFTVYRACTTKDRVALRVEERGADVALIFTLPNEDLSRALKREGSVVVSDANAELHVAEYAAVVGYDPPVHHFGAADGAPIERTLLFRRGVTRTGLFAHGKLVLDTGIIEVIRAVIEWALEDPSARTLAIITMRVIEIAIAAALRPDDAHLAEEWKRAGQDPAVLVEVRELLGPILRRFLPGRIVLGHYGAVRGLNTMSDVDCLATVGDPWPNLGDAANDAAYLKLEDEGHARARATCRAELEQAHGRIRPVHRPRPGRALHVGAERPGGTGWSSPNVKIRRWKNGRPKNVQAASKGEVAQLVAALGGARAAARAIGCSSSTINGYVNGKRAVPAPVLSSLRRALGSIPGAATDVDSDAEEFP